MLISYTDNWVSVPTNSVVTIHKQTVMLHPILDEFYGENLNHDRSSCFAVSKGLVSTAPGTTISPPNTKEPCAPSATGNNAIGNTNSGMESLRSGHVTECAVSH